MQRTAPRGGAALVDEEMDDGFDRFFFSKKGGYKKKYSNKGNRKKKHYYKNDYQQHKPSYSSCPGARMECDDDHDCTHAFPCLKTSCDTSSSWSYNSYKYSSSHYSSKKGVCKCRGNVENDKKCIPTDGDLEGANRECLAFPPGLCQSGSCTPSELQLINY